jgi:cytochrome P450
VETALALGVLALAAWPALRLLSIPPIRREHTGIAVLLGGALVAYAAALVALALVLPALLAPLAALAAVALLAERWRARPGFGARRGLPPGSLSLFPRRPWTEHRFYLEQAARFGPVFKTRLLHRPMICVLGARLGSELLREHEAELEAPPVRFNRFIPRGFLRYMEPADHRVYKRLFQSALAPELLRAREDRAAETVRATLGALAARPDAAATSPAGGLAPREPLRELFFALLLDLFFGVERGSPAVAELRALYAALDIRKMSWIPARRDRRALARIEAWIRRRGREIDGARERGETPPPCVLGNLMRARPGALEDETVLGQLVYVLQVGRADLTGLLVWVLKLLGDHPAWAERLRAAARAGPAGEAEALAVRIVRETLRLEQSEYVYRRARRNLVFRGFTIPKGWRVRVLIREGHRDPASFPEPERFDPDRFLDASLGGARYAPFGLGAHACIGSQVTESFARTVLVELARGFDWRVTRDGPREYGWAHWQPSSRLRIALAPAPRGSGSGSHA